VVLARRGRAPRAEACRSAIEVQGERLAGLSLRPRGPSPLPGLSLVPRDGGRPLPQLRGRGGGGRDSRASERVARADGAPLPASPPQTAWGRGDANRTCRSAIEFSPSPVQFTGEGVGGWGARRAQCDARRSALIRRCHQPPPGVFGGGGRVVLARRGRAPRAEACRSAIEVQRERLAGLSLRSWGPSPPPGLSLVPRDGGRPLPQLRGRGGGGRDSRASERVARADGAPLSRPLPHKLRGGEVTRTEPAGARSNSPLPPCSLRGKGSGNGGPVGHSAMPAEAL
jgi:hypothetical protein